MDWYNLKDVISERKEQVCLWEYISIANDNARLYYKVKNSGFDFYALTNEGCYIEQEIWNPENNVEVVFYGLAYFDDVRHLYFGSEQTDNYGYLFYPDIKLVIELLNELQKLKDKYCED